MGTCYCGLFLCQASFGSLALENHDVLVLVGKVRLQLVLHLAMWLYVFLLSLSVQCHYYFFEMIESDFLSKFYNTIFVLGAIMAPVRGTCLYTSIH